MEDEADDPQDPSYYDERSRAVQRAMALVEVWRYAPPGSIWTKRLWLRPEWRPGVLH